MHLNGPQKEAVVTTEGPVLVLAGAGAGKTRTIVERIAHLIDSGTPPHAILAITFTNKAAKEMTERVQERLGGGRVHGTPLTTTFHALSARILREHAAHFDMPRHFTIYDRSDSVRAVKHALKTLGEEKAFEPRTILGSISRAKGDGYTLATYREHAPSGYYYDLVARVWEKYQSTLRSEKAFDFDDLLLYTKLLLENNLAVRKSYQDRWHFVHIDEYQDTNKVQYEIMRFLAEAHQNVFCVGDLDQNVYSWRGSTIENILEFEKEYPTARTIKLEENYRSTKTIVAVSNDIIRKNKRRKEKTLYTQNSDGAKMALYQGYDESDEAWFVAGKAKELIEKGVHAEEIAVLYRANFQSRVLEDAFITADVPYRVLGTRFFDRKEVKDVLSYLRAALNPNHESDIRRTINTPARGIGKVTVDKLFRGETETLPPKTKEKVDSFYALLFSIRAYAEGHTVADTLTHIIKTAGFDVLYDAQTEEDIERLGNIKELVSLAKTKYGHLEGMASVEAFLEDAALATDQDEMEQSPKGVTLMTVHASKGLEFAHVFVTGLEEGLFPQHRTGSAQGGTVDDEEERRLFYVALTRAKEQVHLTYAALRTVFGQRNPTLPSEFILDIGEEYIEQADAATPREKVVYLE